jgi:hypothetical protein
MPMLTWQDASSTSPQPEAIPAVLDRREGADRRSRPTAMLSRYTLLGGRREQGRRRHEQTNVFVDRFGQGVFLVAGLILLLNVLDAFFTLLFLGVGGEEVNPIALFLLNVGPWAFLATKTVGIGLCTCYLVLVKNFRGVGFGIACVLVAYMALLGWHFYLYSHI